MKISYQMHGILRSIIGGAIGRSFSLVSPFIIMPYLLDYLGSRGFGVWATATSVTSMGAFLDLGIGNALHSRLSRSITKGDFNAARSYIIVSYLILSFISILLIIMGAILYKYRNVLAPYFSLSMSESDLSISAVIYFNFALGIPLSLVHKVFYARQEVASSSIWQIFGALMSIFFSLISIKLMLPSWQVIFLYCFAPNLASIIAIFWVFTNSEELKPSFADITIRNANDLVLSGLSFFILSIVTVSALNNDNMIIARNVGVEAVVNYAVPAKIGSLLFMIVNIIFLPLWTANSQAFSKGEYNWIKLNSDRMSILGAIGVGLFGLILVRNGNYVMRTWMHRSFEGQNDILAAVVLFSVVMAFTSPYNMILNSLSSLRIQILSWIIFAIISIQLKIALIGSCCLWYAPVINAICYMSILYPMMRFSSRNLLEKTILEGPNQI